MHLGPRAAPWTPSLSLSTIAPLSPGSSSPEARRAEMFASDLPIGDSQNNIEPEGALAWNRTFHRLDLLTPLRPPTPDHHPPKCSRDLFRLWSAAVPPTSHDCTSLSFRSVISNASCSRPRPDWRKFSPYYSRLSLRDSCPFHPFPSLPRPAQKARSEAVIDAEPEAHRKEHGPPA